MVHLSVTSHLRIAYTDYLFQDEEINPKLESIKLT